MVGVELKATWTQTRKANGDIVQSRVSTTINAWKSGKFMDLSSRPWSLNTFALTKVWFKCHTVDLRITDISSITSKIKSWLYQDQLEKPEEMILFRPIKMGGLGLHNVRIKALASLIRTFLETSVNPSFLHNMYRTILFRVYVLQDDSISSPPPMPPYYSVSFFNSFRWVRDNTTLNVATMTTAQWYRVLLELEVTMVDTETNSMEYRKSRSELSSPSTDWELTWGRARLKGLGSEATSFLWKLLHHIFPTEERVARILPNSSEYCRQCPTPTQANLEHCFFNCVSTNNVGRSLLQAIRLHDPAVTPAGLLRLEFTAEEANEMPIVWVTAQTLLYMWGVRQNGRVVDLFTTRTVLETKINLLRETRFRNEHACIQEIVEQML
jgi:hypothetical protein